MNIMRITEHVHALKIPFQITVAPGLGVDRFVYIYLICGEKIGLIDTGVSGSKKIIFDYLKSIDREPEEISDIILTHSHPDHIGSAKSIKEASGCSLSIHSAEKSWIENVELQFRERPVPGFHSFVEGSAEVDHVFEDGDVIKLTNDLELETFHTPGHSKGSASFFLKNDGALFCGDAILLPGQMPIFEDFRSCINSVNKLMKISGVKVLFSSWDVPQEGERISALMGESLSYLREIHEAVKVVAASKLSSDVMELCKQVISKLKLPISMVNPLVARSFRSILNGF